MLLPSWMAPRRADGAGVIARAAAAAALLGTGSARLGAELGVPAATVRGWLRRLRYRAGDLRQDATAALGVITAGRDWPCLAPCGSPLGDALAAVIACARAAIACHGYAEEDLDALLGLFGIAAALARDPAANRQVPSRASPCPHPGPGGTRQGHPCDSPRRVHRHHERHDDTSSTPPGETPEMRTPCAHLQ